MPLRMLIDAQTVRLDDVALVGARNLDPPEQAFIQQTGLATGLKGIETALEGVDGVYIALDLDARSVERDRGGFPRAGWVQPGGGRDGLEAIAVRCPLVGIGLSGADRLLRTSVSSSGAARQRGSTAPRAAIPRMSRMASRIDVSIEQRGG